MYNKKIAEIFDEIADMMELEGDERVFEVRAYRRAAMMLETMQEDAGEILKKEGVEGLMALPGIGKSLAASMKEYIETGRISKYADLKKRYPIDFANLTLIQGLGAKRAFKLYKALKVKNLYDLKKAISAHRIRGLEGFGEKSESEIAKGLELLESSGGRMLLGTALPEAERIAANLMKSGLVERAEIAGSTRRMKETVGDLDILVISRKPEGVMDLIAGMNETESVVLKGPTKTTVRLRIGMNCDVRVLERKNFGAGMQYFIGNKDHNVKLRQIAIRKGYKLSEYGLFDKKNRSVAGEDEKEIYKKLDLDYMEPEMRENRGEIELAQQHRIPRLVRIGEIKGDLHTHTTYSDGLNSMDEMAGEAIKLGLDYIGFSDHSRSEFVAKGMDEKKFERYEREIDAARRKHDGRIRILKSAETDILKDGSLDFSNKVLDRMDYVLAAIHTNMKMARTEMTKRLIKCIESNRIDVLAHPTGRLINQRKPIELDLDRVFEAAKDHGVIMEIDSFPERLDLNDENIIKAKEYKLRFAIDTDSHRTSHLSLMRYGIGTAKRGWLGREDVINTLGYDELVRLFKNKGNS